MKNTAEGVLWAKSRTSHTLIERLEASCSPHRGEAADDEPVTRRTAVESSKAAVGSPGAGGQGIPMEDVLAEFGLNPEDLPR